MSWFDKLMPSRISTEKRRRSVPEGLWVKCEGCAAQLYRAELKRNLHVCPKCGHHLRIGARERLELFLDPESGEELAAELEPQDPLKFKDAKRYRDRLAQAQKATGEHDALVVMAGALKSIPIVAAASEFRFIAGSMGSVVGERFARAVSYAIENRRAFVCFSASGGARMHEGLFSLLQMAKTSAALASLAEAGLPYISVMTDPTTGGVSASLAFLGDVNIAEPGALIGFAGPRVIEQTVKETLPDGFQRAEFLLDKGALDMIVDRRRMRDEIAAVLAKLMGMHAVVETEPSGLLQIPELPSAPVGETSGGAESVEPVATPEAVEAAFEPAAPVPEQEISIQPEPRKKAKPPKPPKPPKKQKPPKPPKASKLAKGAAQAAEAGEAATGAQEDQPLAVGAQAPDAPAHQAQGPASAEAPDARRPESEPGQSAGQAAAQQAAEPDANPQAVPPAGQSGQSPTAPSAGAAFELAPEPRVTLEPAAERQPLPGERRNEAAAAEADSEPEQDEAALAEAREGSPDEER